ncbi:MAG: hypothetical protein JO256_13325, partial [Alphaproteobacteria bacterium]|nr:hypothetical protein [Alphaproteobacteria bacterium]
VTDQNGKPAALSYLASDNRLRVIGAAGVSYDAQRNIVVADTSQAKMANQLAVN